MAGGAVFKYTTNNSALTAAGGVWTWTISNHGLGG